jgi:hypothetical protein
MPLDERDGGLASRKLWFCVGTALAMIATWFCTGFIHSLQPTFDTVIGGILAISGLYLTGNVASRWVAAKSQSGISFQGEVPGIQAQPTEPRKVSKPPASDGDGS